MDSYWQEALRALERLRRRVGSISAAVPPELIDQIDGAVQYSEKADALLLHKGRMQTVPLERLRLAVRGEAIFANDVFVLYLDSDKASKRFRDRLARSVRGLTEREHRRPVPSYLREVDEGRFAGAQKVFIHVPKTGGHSIFNAVAAQSIRPIYFRRGTELDLATPHLSACDLIGGHFPYHVFRSRLGPARYFAILRDPLERLISAAGHARRPDMDIATLSPALRLLRTIPLRHFVDREEGITELRLQHWMLTGSSHPSSELMEQRLEEITVGTLEGMDRYLSNRGRFLDVAFADFPRLNVTPKRSTLVPPEEIEELVSTHGDLFEDAQDLYRMVRRQEVGGSEDTTLAPLG